METFYNKRASHYKTIAAIALLLVFLDQPSNAQLPYDYDSNADPSYCATCTCDSVTLSMARDTSSPGCITVYATVYACHKQITGINIYLTLNDSLINEGSFVDPYTATGCGRGPFSASTNTGFYGDGGYYSGGIFFGTQNTVLSGSAGTSNNGGTLTCCALGNNYGWNGSPIAISPRPAENSTAPYNIDSCYRAIVAFNICDLSDSCINSLLAYPSPTSGNLGYGSLSFMFGYQTIHSSGDTCAGGALPWVSIAAKKIEPNPLFTPIEAYAYPNPFSNSTKIEYLPSEEGVLAVQFYTVTGQLIGTENIQIHQGKKITVDFTPPTISNGDVYFCRLISPSSTIVKKLIIIR
jgi:hypothetical protein